MNAFDSYSSCLERHGLKRTENVLIAVIGEKILEHWQGERVVERYPFSHSRRRLSCTEGSLGTPWGLHEVAAKHGDGAPPGMVFVGRVATGQCYGGRDDAGPNQPTLVTTRILRLRGLEPGLNAGPGVDSFERTIYIHGTNYPDRFPENISAGCLLMRDGDLIELFEKVAVGTHVLILK